MEILTLLGAVITASVSILWHREEWGFTGKKREKKNLFLEKIEGRGLRKTNTKTALVHFVAFL